MKLIIDKNREVYSAGTWGTKNENNYEILDFEFPEELEEYNKRIVYYLGDEKVWDAIVNNKAILTNAITTKGSVKAYVWLTKTDSQYETDVDFRTQLFEMNFYENENASGIVPTEQQVDGFNTMLTAMNAKIDEVDALETTIETAEAERQEAEATRVSNENTRESNESTRQTNEQTRQTQEADRERRTNEAIANIQDKTAEYNANAEAKTTAFNNNATQKTNDFNSNYTQKVNDFNTNATSKTNEFNSNASSKTTTFNDNATSKTNTFNSNASSKTTDFNTNAENKTSAFNTNASDKTTAFDNNASSKTSDFNTNAESKTNTFNDNATQKTTDFNNNAQAKTEAFDEHTEEMQQEIDELSANMPWNTTEQATEISVDDAAKYSKNKLELFGNTEQDNTKITYKCDGTETGDYYLTYNSTDYYFTMPTIAEGDILVFNTTDLKLYLADTEITTESTGTGTNLTFIPSPNPDYPQDIHVVSGENIIEIQGENLFDKNNFNIKSLNGGGTAGSYGQYTAATQQKHIYIQCKPNTDYVVIKDITSIPVLGVNQTSEIPAIGVSYTGLYFSSTSSGKIHIKTGSSARYLDIRINTWEISQKEINKIAETLFIAEGTNVNMPYVPYYHADYPINLGDIEPGKIGDHQDKFVKDGSTWKIPNKIKKIDSYNGETITTPYISTTGGLDMGATVYYVEKEDYTITDTTLITQLNEIYEHLKLVKGTNNITVTVEDLAPYMKLTYMQDLPSKLDNLDSRLALLD